MAQQSFLLPEPVQDKETALVAWLQQQQQRISLERLFGHVILLAVILVGVRFGTVELSSTELTADDINFGRPAVIIPQADQTTETQIQPLTLSGELQLENSGVFQPGLAGITPAESTQSSIEEIRAPEISTYVVQAGDTIFGIAQQYGLEPSTLLWSNPTLEDNPDLLSVGQAVTIIPVDGVYHQVGGADTIEAIAAVYKADSQAIIDYPLNDIDPENAIIQPGQWLIVPGGEKPYVPRYVTVASANAPEAAINGTGSFGWPANGRITQEYWSGHRGLDIAAWTGAPIYAADSGYVVSSQWDDSGYGRMVLIDHGNGFKTMYAHLSAAYVSEGDEVSTGQQIAEMGSTGNSTGPHLHFEMHLNGVQRNPWGFLP